MYYESGPVTLMALSKRAHIFNPSRHLILVSSHFCWRGLISLCYCFSQNFWSQCTLIFQFPVVRILYTKQNSQLVFEIGLLDEASIQILEPSLWGSEVCALERNPTGSSVI